MQSECDSHDGIIALLRKDEPLSKEEVVNLQNLLASEGYMNNYDRYKADGDMGDLTRDDIMCFVEDNPEVLISLGQGFKEDLINNGFGKRLVAVVEETSVLNDLLMVQVEGILDDKASLEELSRDQLKQVQANWYMMGTYPSHLRVDGDIGGGSRGAYMAQYGRGGNHNDGRWTMEAQLTGVDVNTGMGDLNVILTSPEGEEHIFAGRSGILGKEMLPGLDKKLPNSGEKHNATYKVDWRACSTNTDELPEGMRGANGRGNFIRLGSDRNQTERGGELGKDELGYLGIHTDGDSNGDGVFNDGSKGCVALNAEVSDKLFGMLVSIPSSKKPLEFGVLPPDDSLKETLSLLDKKSGDASEDSVVTTDYGSGPKVRM